MRSSRAGFTLLEMMVVIIIITLLTGAAVAGLSLFLRDEGPRQAGAIVSQTFAQAKQLSAETRVLHFIKFENHPGGYGRMTVHKDINGNQFLDASDEHLATRDVVLPKGVTFDPKKMPSQGFVGIAPSGYTTGYVDIPSSTYEKKMRDLVVDGDIVLRTKGDTVALCIDVDPAAGKVRKFRLIATK